MKLIFPGSFDPFTKGHESIVRRALDFSDEIVIAVGYNGLKGNTGMFTVEERVKMISDFYEEEPRVSVISYTTLTTDIANELGCSHILRGVRTVIDFEYERSLADVNRHLVRLYESMVIYGGPVLDRMLRELYGHLVIRSKHSIEIDAPEGRAVHHRLY